MRTSVFLSGGPTVFIFNPALGRLQLMTGPASVWQYPWSKVTPSEWKKIPTSDLRGTTPDTISFIHTTTPSCNMGKWAQSTKNHNNQHRSESTTTTPYPTIPATSTP